MPAGLSMKERVEEAVRTVRGRCAGTPAVGLVLGSGWGSIAERRRTATVIPYAEIPGFPRCSVEGHAGDLVIDTGWGPLTAILHGRAHRYEGWSLEQVTFPVRVLGACGVKTLVVTNASGGLQGVEPGEVVLIADHLNLMGDNPLIGVGASERRFVEMVDAYDPGLLQLAEEVARKNGLSLKRVTLVAVTGPTYETLAEAQMLRVLGAQVVCMSTVPEVIVARSLGLRVLGLSLVTNMAGRPGPGGKTHEAVVAMGLQQAPLMERLLQDIISRL
jgi:purine-nucleoside phosphorylase